MNKDNIKNIEPIDIILVSYNRLNFLKKIVNEIYERTNYPHRLIVVDNNSDDGSKDWLQNAKLNGFVSENIFLEKNNGLANGYTEGFKHVRSKYFITTQDDCLPPKLQPCWLERMVHLFEKYDNEYLALSMRIQRIRHRKVDEFDDIIESPTSLASVFRIQRKEEIEQVGGFGNRQHWEGVSFVKMTKHFRKKYGVTTHIYSDHIGFMSNNKGFKEGFKDYFTYSPERVNQGELQPYPDVEPKSLIPIKINTTRDSVEQNKRKEYYDYWGHDMRKGKLRLTEEQLELSKYCETGVGLDLGCGMIKCNNNCIGMDVYPHECVDVVGDCTDLWMFKDNELDFIVNAHLLEHLPDTPTVLKEWKRVLKPGGILGIAVPDGEIKHKYIIKNGHKVNLGLKTLELLVHRVVGMKILRLEQVKKSPGKFVALIIAKK